METRPEPSTGLTARLATVCPGTKFTSLVLVKIPLAFTSRKLGRVGLVTVTFRTAAEMPAGTPGRPVTWTVIQRPAPSGPGDAPSPLRVSAARNGARAV